MAEVFAGRENSKKKGGAKKMPMEDLEAGDFLPEWDATVKRVTVRENANNQSRYGVVVSLDLHGEGRKDAHTLVGAYDDEYEVER